MGRSYGAMEPLTLARAIKPQFAPGSIAPFPSGRGLG